MFQHKWAIPRVLAIWHANHLRPSSERLELQRLFFSIRWKKRKDVRETVVS